MENSITAIDNTTVSVERTPETELLAALLQKSVFDIVDLRVWESDFTDSRNRMIFIAISDLEHSHKISDVTSVIKLLKNRMKINEAGGREYILAIAKLRRKMDAPSAVNAIIALRKKQ